MHPKNTICNRCMTNNDSNKNIKKNYTISGRTIEEMFNSTIKILKDHYRCNNEVMEDNEKINNLENIIDLIEYKESI